MGNLEDINDVMGTVIQDTNDKVINTNEGVEAIKEALIKQRQELEQAIYGIGEGKEPKKEKIEPIENPIILDPVSPISLNNEGVDEGQNKKITPLGSMPLKQDLSVEQKIDELIKYMSVTTTVIEEAVSRLTNQEKMLADIIKSNKKDSNIL